MALLVAECLGLCLFKQIPPSFASSKWFPLPSKSHSKALALSVSPAVVCGWHFSKSKIRFLPSMLHGSLIQSYCVLLIEIEDCTRQVTDSLLNFLRRQFLIKQLVYFIKNVIWGKWSISSLFFSNLLVWISRTSATKRAKSLSVEHSYEWQPALNELPNSPLKLHASFQSTKSIWDETLVSDLSRLVGGPAL